VSTTRVTLAIAVLLVLAGCGAVPEGGVGAGTAFDESMVGDRVQDRYDRLGSYRATIVRTVTVDGTTERTRATVVYERPNSLRIDYEVGPRAGEVVLVDATTVSVYADGRLVRREPRTDPLRNYSAYDRLVARTLRGENVTYAGTERVAGHHAVAFSASPEDDPTVDRTVWIDSERQVPLRLRTVRTGERNATVTTTVVSLTLDADTRGAFAYNGSDAGSR
jgi:outer membrane lipoprotein-sorting protein